MSLWKLFNTDYYFRRGFARGMIVVDFIGGVWLIVLSQTYEQLVPFSWVVFLTSFVWLGVYRVEFKTWRFWRRMVPPKPRGR